MTVKVHSSTHKALSYLWCDQEPHRILVNRLPRCLRRLLLLCGKLLLLLKELVLLFPHNLCNYHVGAAVRVLLWFVTGINSQPGHLSHPQPYNRRITAGTQLAWNPMSGMNPAA